LRIEGPTATPICAPYDASGPAIRSTRSGSTLFCRNIARTSSAVVSVLPSSGTHTGSFGSVKSTRFRRCDSA
jgi:hypothetical protein